MSTPTEESFSLRDALDLQVEAPTTSEELSEARATVDELHHDSQKQLQSEEGEIDDDFIDSTNNIRTHNTVKNNSNVVVQIDSSVEEKESDTRSENLVAENRSNVLMAINESQNETESSVSECQIASLPRVNGNSTSVANSSSSNVTQKKQKLRIPVLYGSLYFQTIWDDQTQRKLARTILKGTWRFNDDLPSNAHPEHAFELTSRGINVSGNSESWEPQSGVYSGWFGLTYPHTTPKGKSCTKLSTIKEPKVKLEFRKLHNFYRVTGFGNNLTGGDFRLHGTVKPAKNERNEYVVELRKTYTGTNDNISSIISSRTPSSISTHQQERKLSNATSAPPPPPTIHRQSVPPPPPGIGPPYPPQPPPFLLEAEGSKHFLPPTRPSPPKSSESTQRHQERQDIPIRRNGVVSTFQPIPQHSSQDSLSLTQMSTPGSVDRVNGKGMWYAWTRSFDTPLLALLDLFDNAVDASWTLLPEPAQLQHQDPPSKPKIQVELDRIGRNGVVMRNASKYIPPLKEVLQVYKSTKARDGDNSIGENGIGVKHACASLSGLSFVFTKTTDPVDETVTMGIGVLMQDLQRDDGIVLPSIAFPLIDVDNNPLSSLDEVKEKLEEHCANFPDTWGVAIREYGDHHFGDGIDRCLQHMDELRTGRDWRNCENVFAVVLANLKHAAFEESNEDDKIIEIEDRMNSRSPKTRRGNSTPNKSHEFKRTETSYHAVQQDGDSDQDEDAERSLSLLRILKEKLPYLYLHLHDLDITVENKAIESIYWERRLAELSRFEIQISQTELWSKIDPIRYDHNAANSVHKITNRGETVRFFCGFDPYRCISKQAVHLLPKEEKDQFAVNEDDSMMSFLPGGGGASVGLTPMGNNTAIKVYLYSRQSGRLIKVQNDPRNELGLSAGSTDFSQGLTVIIDDHNGTLPLNPTKQDTAYGHSKHGQIHAANLKEWTAGITHFYWNHHYECLGSSKIAVTRAVTATKPALEQVYRNYKSYRNNGIFLVPTVTPLCKGTFASYPSVDFKVSGYSNIPKIRANKHARSTACPVINPNEIVRLDSSAAAEKVNQITEARAEKKRQRMLQRQYINSGCRVPHQVSQVEGANSTGPKRLKSQYLNEIELQDRLVMGDKGQPPGSAQDLTSENSRLRFQLQQHSNENKRLNDNIRSRSIEVRMLREKIQEFTEEVHQKKENIAILMGQKKKLSDFAKMQQAQATKWKAEAERLRHQLGLSPRSRQDLSTQECADSSSADNDVMIDLSQDSSASVSSSEIKKLRRQIKIYKSRAEFYMAESQNKKKQIEILMQEKSRFEERVQELEEAQLTVDTSHEANLLQF